MFCKPNLFIIGAAKCATSSLHTYLGQHPQIFMSPLKEPGFFAGDKEDGAKLRPFTVNGQTIYKPYCNDLDSYLALFDGADGATYVGESSTAYSQLPVRSGVVDRIYSFNKNARIVYVLRDPIDRTISHYWWHVQHEGEKRDLLSAIRENSHYCDVSYYAMQLRPYLDRFGAERVFWLTTESLASEPVQILKRLFAWLEIDETFTPAGINARSNETPNVLNQPTSRILNRLRFSPAWERISPWVPKLVRTSARRLSERKIDRAAVDSRAAVEFLRSIQVRQTDELRRLLNYDFTEWKTVNGGGS